MRTYMPKEYLDQSSCYPDEINVATAAYAETERDGIYYWAVPTQHHSARHTLWCTVVVLENFFLFQHLDNAVLWKHKWLVHGSVVRFFTLSLCLWGPLLEAPRAPLSLILSTKEGYWGWSKIQDVTHKMWRNTGGKDKCLDYTPSSPSSRHEALISALRRFKDWVSSKLPVWAGEGCLGFLGFVSFDRWISRRPKISPNGPNVSMSEQHSSPNLGER